MSSCLVCKSSMGVRAPCCVCSKDICLGCNDQSFRPNGEYKRRCTNHGIRTCGVCKQVDGTDLVECDRCDVFVCKTCQSASTTSCILCIADHVAQNPPRMIAHVPEMVEMLVSERTWGAASVYALVSMYERSGLDFCLQLMSDPLFKAGHVPGIRVYKLLGQLKDDMESSDKVKKMAEVMGIEITVYDGM